ncbi:hypothetical protein [Frankia sp. Cr1]|uniref:hypothetical protein n=1 Tax=Frankia sp. Cr1 TaxID=3073931 RepID=UPI002AD59536|nr:hypothetical protein [Frankia sp. Cr1]
MSLQLLDFDQRREALDVADSAMSSSRAATPRTVAMLSVRKARTHAALGETRECTDALRRAEAALDRAPSNDDPSWVRYFDEAEFSAQVGMTYFELGAAKEADSWFSRALQSGGGVTRQRDRATYLIRHAAVKVDLGELEHAHALCQEALPFLEEAPSARNGYRIGELRARLKPHVSRPEIRTLDTRLAASVV